MADSKVISDSDAPAAKDDSVKVSVRSTPIVTKPEEPVVEKPELSVHHELVISPSAKEVAETVASIEPTPEPKVTAVPPADATKSQPTQQEVKSPSPPLDDAPKTEPKPVMGAPIAQPENPDAKAAENTEMQSPKVFDTKQYHLPINEGVAHGKGKFVIVFLVLLLLVAMAGTVAIDAGWIKPGFELPFDLIK